MVLYVLHIFLLFSYGFSNETGPVTSTKAPEDHVLVLLGDAAEYELATHSELVPWQPYNAGLPIKWFITPRIYIL
jgi:hypothetical protein